MLPLRLRLEPVFDIEEDLAKISTALGKEKGRANPDVIPFPTSRAYVLDEMLEPVAIFDHPGPGFAGFLKLALTVMPNPIDNPKGYVDVEVMNRLREVIHNGEIDLPYTVAVLVGDDVCFHFPASLDLVIVLCDRLHDRDIVDRGIWEYIYDAGIAGIE